MVGQLATHGVLAFVVAIATLIRAQSISATTTPSVGDLIEQGIGVSSIVNITSLSSASTSQASFTNSTTPQTNNGSVVASRSTLSTSKPSASGTPNSVTQSNSSRFVSTSTTSQSLSLSTVSASSSVSRSSITSAGQVPEVLYINSTTAGTGNSTATATALSNLTAITNGTRYNCTDSTCGLACSSSWSSWSSASKKWLSAFPTTSTYSIKTYNATVTQVPVATSNGSIYATCNGIPRHSGGIDYWTTTNTTLRASASTIYTIATASSGTFSNPVPSCIIPPTQCGDMVSQWHQDNYLAFPFNVSTGFFTSWPQGPPIDFPHCNTTGYDYVSWYNDTQLIDGSGCWLKGAAARLFYWPEPILADNRSCPDATWTVPRQMAANASALVTTVVTLFETYYTEVPPTTVTMTSPTMYLSIEDLEGRGPSWAFKGGGPIAATVLAVDPEDLVSMLIAPPMITNEALSSSAMSVIAHQEINKYTDLFGYAWQQHQYGVGGPNLAMQTVKVNPADLGRPPPPLSYYFGAIGWYCLNAGPYSHGHQPISAGLPPGMPCDTIFDDQYLPWVQIPMTVGNGPAFVSTCNMMFGWDPPIALQPAATVEGPSSPGQATATTTSPSAGTTTPATPGSTTVTVSTPTVAPVQDPTSSSSAVSSKVVAGSSAASSPASSTIGNAGTQSSSPNQGASQGQADPSTPNSPSSTQQLSSPNQGASQTQAIPPTTSPAPIATIGSGSSAVTIVSDPTSSGQVVAISAGGSSVLSAGTQTTIGSQQISVGSTGNVVAASATTINLDLGQTMSQAGSVGVTLNPGQSSVNAGAGGQSAQSSVVVIAGQTLSAGGSAAVISGATISAASSGQVVVQSGGSSSVVTAQSNGALSFGNGQSTTIVPVAGPATSAQASAVVIQGQTLTAGGSAATINGATVSAVPNGQVVVQSGGSSQTLAATNGVINLGNGQQATATNIPASHQSAVVFAGQTLTAGGPAATIQGATVSVLADGGIVVQSAGSTQTLAASNGIVNLGNGQQATLAAIPAGQASAAVIAGQTLVPGGSEATVNGQTISALASNVYVVQSNGVSSTVTAGSNGIVSLGHGLQATITPAPTTPITGAMIAGQTLAPGGSALTINGETISALAPNIYVVQSNGHTSTITAAANGFVSLANGLQATITQLSTRPSGMVTTINGHTISALPNGNGAVIDGTTVTSGGPARTIHGTVYSINSAGQLVAAGSSTLGNGLGGLIGAVEMMAANAKISESASASAPLSTTSGSKGSSTTTAAGSSRPISGNADPTAVSTTSRKSGASGRTVSSLVAVVVVGIGALGFLL